MKKDWMFSDWLRRTFHCRGYLGFSDRKRFLPQARMDILIPCKLKHEIKKYAKANNASQSKVVEFALLEYLGQARTRIH